ncbi:MAG TPA: D-hexose-6-phosphate mutarotase [Terracidiphilus sp.]|nr:D-hexose-6-phosphate mutarotase [Terracidiphilus sp.]
MNQAQIDALNRAFGIPNVVAVVVGNGGLPKIRVSAASASAEVYLHGAHVTSWQPANCEEVLFLSEKSGWEDGRAIRGGIPICFPWFRAKADDPSAPAHGFVRTKQWRLESVKTEGDSVVVLCSTESDESTQRWWPHSFRLLHRVTIGSTLRLQLMVKNTGRTPLLFEEALHTYFRVSQPDKVRVRGLDQVKYLDNVDGNRTRIQSGDLMFAGKTDNAYVDVENAVELIDAGWHRSLRTEKANSSTTVVWNPWEDGAAAISDLGDEEFRDFACVEASNILDSVVSLGPGQEHRMQALISIVATDMQL